MALVTTPTIADGTNKIFRSDFTIPSESHLRVILSGGTPPNTDATTTTVAYVYNDFILSSTTAKIYKAIGTTSIGDLLTDTAKFEERVAYEQDVLSNQFDVINNSVVFHDTDIPTNGITVYVNVASTPDELTDSPSAIAQIYANLAEILTADDNAILTAADVVSTNADVVSTNADVVSTNADVALTNADVVSTNADVVLTNADVTSTNADVVTIAGRLDSVQSNSETVEANLATITSTPVAGYLAGAEANAVSASASEAAAALSATEALTANPNVRISPVASSLLLSGTVSLTVEATATDITTTTAVYATTDFVYDTLTGILYDCIAINTVGILLTNATYFTAVASNDINITAGSFSSVQGKDTNGNYIHGFESAIGTIPNATFTGSTDGYKWVWKENGLGYGYFDYKPSYSLYTLVSDTDHRAVLIDGIWYNTSGLTGETCTIGSALGKNISILPNPVMVTGDKVQYIDLNDTLIENVMDDLEVVGDANFKSDVSIEGNLSGMSGFDLGQEWVNVSAERAVEITYKNETGRPIMISVSLTESYSGYYYVFVDSGNGEVRVASSQNGGAVGIEFNSSGIVVPNGGTYRVFVLDANQVLTHWAELR